MISPNVLLKEIVEKLQSIPALAEVQIDAYDSESELYKNVDQALDNMNQATSVLVFWEGCEFPRTGETKGPNHKFSMFLRCQSSASVSNALGYHDLIQAIMDGKPEPPSGDGYWKFIDSELTNCEPFNELSVTPIQDGDGITFWGIRFSCTEK